MGVQAAQVVGLTLRPTILMLFGNPKAGTRLMQQYPNLALDLPLKVLIWEVVKRELRSLRESHQSVGVYVSTSSHRHLDCLPLGLQCCCPILCHRHHLMALHRLHYLYFPGSFSSCQRCSILPCLSLERHHGGG